jgi:hypothetical protein
VPGYPLFLRAFTHVIETRGKGPSEKALVDGWLDRAKAANLLLDGSCALLIALIALRLSGRRGAIVGAAAWALQPWTSLFAIHPLADVFAMTLTAACFAVLARAKRVRSLFIAGLVVGACQMVRSDGILLAIPVVIVASVRWRHGIRVRAVAAATAGWLVMVAPWCARNMIQFGRPAIFAGGTGIDNRGQVFDRSAVMAWMRTWAASEYATTGVAWRLPGTRLSINDIPPEAWDDAGERARLAALLDEYNAAGATLTPEVEAKLRALAAERAAKYSVATFVGLPLRRAALMTFAPVDGFGLGTLDVLRRFRGPAAAYQWFLVIGGLLGSLLLIRRRDVETRSIGLAIAIYVVVRALGLAWLMPSAEPRYLIESLPLLAAAMASVTPRAREIGSASEPSVQTTHDPIRAG